MKKKYLKSYDVKLNASYIFLACIFLVYETFTSIVSFFPLMYGWFFTYMFYLLEQTERTLNRLDFRWYFSLIFLLFIDITHNFFVFSSWVAFFIFYYACADWLKTNFKIGKFMPFIFVLCSYGVIFLCDIVFTYISEQKLIFFSLEYIVSVAIEMLLVYIFFKDKI